jgi:hypothetical protein
MISSLLHFPIDAGRETSWIALAAGVLGYAA